MKSSTCFFASCFLLTRILHAAAPFEGKIHIEMKSEKSANEMGYSIKGDNIRIDLQTGGQTVSGFTDAAGKEFIMLMPAQKICMALPMKDAAALAEKASSAAGHLEKTGKSENILGYACNQYFYKGSQGEATEIWLADGLGNFKSLNSFFGKAGPGTDVASAWEQELMNKGAFPLRVISRNSAGKETLRMEATAVEKQSLPDSLFTVPDGYTKISLPAFGGMPGLAPTSGK